MENNLIPRKIIDLLEGEVRGLQWGEVVLEIVINDNKPKFRIVKKVSIKPDDVRGNAIA